ncbi:MAG: NAD-dependent epimerase [Proteobacteria bacterium]|nr:NAD-dependent epimerase [Pseudomonadota bacterium]
MINDFKHILVTGAAGFIGFFLSKRLLEDGFQVTGIDNLNDYYDVRLKESRLNLLKEYSDFTFHKTDIADEEALSSIFKAADIDVVVNLAAQAGVRYSIENPQAYIQSNLQGFGNILEQCRHHKIKHLVFASSSSVYGANTKMPFSVHDNVDHPVSLYAATKKSNELMAHAYSHLYGLPCTGLRFFTVYGPWGRPDMAYFLFVKAILSDQPIKIFNHGNMKRDFTYIDDIIEGVVRVMAKPPLPDPGWHGNTPDPSSSFAKYKIFNIGNNTPVELLSFVQTIEEALGKKANKVFLEMQPGDVEATFADIDDLANHVGFRPGTPIEDGLGRFVAWYREYYGV